MICLSRVASTSAADARSAAEALSRCRHSAFAASRSTLLIACLPNGSVPGGGRTSCVAAAIAAVSAAPSAACSLNPLACSAVAVTKASSAAQTCTGRRCSARSDGKAEQRADAKLGNGRS
eukprot:2686745-Pleurochrysis_carterae.AAC.2